MTEAELNWEFIKAQLPAGWRELAVEWELIRPQPPQLKTKVTDIEQVLRPLLLRSSWEASLVTTMGTIALAKAAAEANSTGIADPSVPSTAGGEAHGFVTPSHSLVDMSAVALHKWERKLGPYLAELLARMLQSTSAFSAMQWSGYDIVLADGTTVTRPGAQGTTARVLYALHLADMTLLQCFVTDEHGSERLRAFEMHPEQLWIADRCYCNPPDIAWVADAGAALMVRYNRGALPLYDAKSRPFDVLEHVRTLRDPEAMAEWRVWVHPQDHKPIQGRLCAVRLPEEQAEEGRQRLRREQGAKVTEASLEAAAWVMVFTNVPRLRLDTARVLGLYPVRWQMELEIKRDKSLGGIDKLPNFLPETIAAWLQTKLLLQQIARKIVSPAVAFPPSAAAVHPIAGAILSGGTLPGGTLQPAAATLVPTSRSDPRASDP